MVIGIIIGLIALVIVIVGISTIVHLQHEGKKIKLIIFAILIFLFIFSFIYVISKDKINVKSTGGAIQAGKSYASWTGNAIKTIFTSTKESVTDLKKSLE